MNDEELRDHRGFVILEFQIFAKSLKKIPYRRAAQLCFILGWNGLKPILHSISTGEKEIGFPSVFFLKTPHHQKNIFFGLVLLAPFYSFAIVNVSFVGRDYSKLCFFFFKGGICI